MAKNSAIVKIIPMIDQKKMKDGVKQLSAMNKVANIGKSVAKAGAAGAAGMSILGLVLNKNSEYLESMSSILDEILAKADSLSTISADLGSMSTSSGSFALTSAAMESQGINQEGRDKVIASLQDKMASGELISGANQTLESVLAGLQKQWQEAKASGNMAKAKQIEETIGLRGKQASEFLQGDLGKDKAEMAMLVGLTEKQLTEQIEANAKLEGVQAQSKAVEDLKMQGSLSKVANAGTIKSMVELESFKKRQMLEMYGSFDTMAAAEKTKQEMFMLITKISNSVLSKFNGLKTPEQYSSVLVGILVDLLGKVFLALKEVFVQLGNYIKDGIKGAILGGNSKSSDANAKDLKKEDNRGRI